RVIFMAFETVRVVVRVPPRDIGRRARDEMPAEYRLAVADFAPNRSLDPASLQIVRWDHDAGRAVGGSLPLRWYDDVVPDDLPECEQNVHATNGLKLTFISRPRWGDFYNLLGQGTGGRLVWPHTQQGNKPSYYAISFRLLSRGQRPTRLAPRGFVGD